MSQTENYGFNIPEENEFYDMELENENWRKLDAVLKEISDKLDAVKTTEYSKAPESRLHDHVLCSRLFCIKPTGRKRGKFYEI